MRRINATREVPEVSAELSGCVSGLTHDGRGVVNLADGPVFLEDALPGEEVRFRVARRKRRYALGTLTGVIAPSPDRAEPRCRHFGVCGGCRLQQLQPAAQLVTKEGRLLHALKRIGRVEPETVLEPIAGDPWHYRRRARLSVRWVAKKDRAVVGFRERKASFVTDATQCEILAEPFASMISPLSELISALSIRARLPQIELTAGDRVNALVFRVLDAPNADDRERLTAFGAEHGVDVWLQPGSPTTIEPLTNVRPLTYALPEFGVTIKFGPVDFVQVNANVNRELVSRAVALLAPGPGDRVLDLFAGLGNFSLPLARRAGHVTGVEGEQSLIERAEDNARANEIVNTRFETDNLYADEATGAWSRSTYDRVLLDPPRAGARRIVENIGVLGATRVVYVSCDPATLARDAGILVDGHGYRLSAAGIVDMFPHTAHVEAIAVFDRVA